MIHGVYLAATILIMLVCPDALAQEVTILSDAEFLDADWSSVKIVDGTVGDGGHAQAILDATQSSSQLLGLDRDPEALRAAGEALAIYGGRVHLIQSDFADLALGQKHQVLADLAQTAGDEGEPGGEFGNAVGGDLETRVLMRHLLEADDDLHALLLRNVKAAERDAPGACEARQRYLTGMSNSSRPVAKSDSDSGA